MTKKSPGRIARDEMKKNSRMWDELEENYKGIVLSISEPHQELARLYSEPIINQMVPDKLETANAFRTLASDINSFKADLAAIHKLHEGRTGGFTDDNDQDLGVHVYEAYTGFHTRYHAVIMPAVVFLAEQAEKARLIVTDFLEKQATDVNVVTDVDVKTPEQEEPHVPVTEGVIQTAPDGTPLSEEDAALANELLAKYPAPIAAIAPEVLLQQDQAAQQAAKAIESASTVLVGQPQSE